MNLDYVEQFDWLVGSLNIYFLTCGPPYGNLVLNLLFYSG